MKASALYFLLRLAGTAFTTSIIGYAKEDCSGAYGQCTNVGPNFCCGAIRGTGGAQSAAFTYLPSPAKIVGYQEDDRNLNACATTLASFDVGAGSYCLSVSQKHGQYTGLAYFFPGDAASPGAEDGQKCTDSGRIDTIVLIDGTKFNIESLPDGMAGELWQLAAQGVTGSSVPQKFGPFEEIS